MRRLAWPALLLAAVLTAAACSHEQAPPRSPFGDNGAASVVPATTTAGPSATATATPMPTATAPATLPPVSGTPAAVDRELAIGQAIAQLAQWLGVEQASLNFQSFDAQDFPSSCLGVERPGVACATVVTPGARVVLRDALDHAHDVRMDAAMRRFAWAPQQTATGTVASVDLTAKTVTVDTASGSLMLRRVPGTLEDVQLSALHAGDAVSVAYDGGPVKADDYVLVWIVQP